MHSEHYPTLSYFRKRQSPPLTGKHILLVFMIVVVLLAACGGPAKNASGSKTGGMVTVMNGAAQLFTDNFNPWLYTHNIGTQGLIYETLFHWNRQDGSITPLLATSEQFTDNNTGITITTRQGVKWSDGKPFSADDVLFTFHLTSTFPGADTTGLGEEIKSITEPNCNTIHITLKKASSTVMWDLAGTFIVPKHIWQKVKGDPQQNTNVHPVGTGPFILQSFAPEKVPMRVIPTTGNRGNPTLMASSSRHILAMMLPPWHLHRAVSIGQVCLYQISSIHL